MIWHGRKHRSIGHPFSWATAKAILAACVSVALALLALPPQTSAQDASYYRQQAAACRARAAQEQQLARQYASVASESSAHQQAAQANLDAAAAYDRQAAALGSGGGGGGRNSGSPSRPISPALARQNTANQMASELANRLQADPEAQRRLQEERNSDRQSLAEGAQRSGDMATQRLTAALDYDPRDPSQSRVEPVKSPSDSPSQASQKRPETRSDRSMPPDDSAQRAQLLSAVESLRQDFPTPDPANQTVDFTDSGSVASWGQANSMPNFPFPADTPLVADRPTAGDDPSSGGGGSFDAFASHPAANPGASNTGGGYVEPPYAGMADRSSTSTWGSPTSVLDASSPNWAAAGGPIGPSGGDSRTAFTLDTTGQNSLDDAANPPAEGPRNMSVRERLAGEFNQRALGLADTSQSDDPSERDDDALNRAASPVSLLWRTHGRWLPGVHSYLQDVHSKFNTLFDHGTTEIMRDPASPDQ